MTVLGDVEGNCQHRPADPSGWTVIVPVKSTSIAKSRLAGISTRDRQQLAIAFALDTVSAALRCPVVGEVVVVTNDPIAERCKTLGAVVVLDVPNAGLNPALVYAAGVVRRRAPAASIAALSSDLPALRAHELGVALRVNGCQRWFVRDAANVGTTLIAARPGAPWTPLFGTGSAAAHLAAGMTDLDIAGLDSVRRDVDTEDDLRAALDLGVGPETSRVVATIGALA